MKNEGIVIQNSKKFINEGNGLGKGLLYCGEIYANENGCPCGTCDGRCGPDNGCPCPDCEYTLSYILYSSGKMKCEKCNKTLLRINIFNLRNMAKSNNNLNPSFRCNICHSSFSQELFIPLMHCKKCNYNMCPKCAFSKITSFEQNIPNLMKGDQIGAGMIYCGQNYTNYESCLCGTCDGNCGPDNGCPCPLCDSILGYNIYLKSNKMRCDKCKNLLVKTYLYHLKKIKGLNKFQCFLCSYIYDNRFDCQVIYHCFKCKKNVCQSCAFKNNILNIKNLCFPKPPFFLVNMEEMKRKIQKEKIEECKICKQRGFNITQKKEGGKNICIYLKTLIGRIYTINIDDSESIGKLKEELRKFDDKYKFYNTILFYKNKILDDDSYISNCGIDNESLINIILK